MQNNLHSRVGKHFMLSDSDYSSGTHKKEALIFFGSPKKNGHTSIILNKLTSNLKNQYMFSKINAYDKYDIFLSGAAALLKIENPNATTNKELIIFRDSYGSSLTPLLVQNYSTVTVVDTRYISPKILEKYIEFNNQDVLFEYSVLLINNSSTVQ